MSDWKFALSRRWLGYLAAAVVFAIACVALSNWQLARAHETAAENARIARNYDATPVQLDKALPDPHSYHPRQEWLRVRVTGRYLSADQLLVRNRPLEGSPGYEILTPLQAQDGSIFIVDRGWIPAGSNVERPDSVPAAPTGQVTVTARLKASEPAFANRTAPPGQIPTIDLGEIRDRIGGNVHTGAYGLMSTESPPAATTPKHQPRPQEDVGLHWSYMIQWLIFAAIAFFGLGYALRQEYRNRNSDDPRQRARVAERDRRRNQRPLTDDEAEDRLLEQR